MVDIEVRRTRMYFSVENGVKMGAIRLGYAKYNFGAKTALFWPF